MTRIETGEMMVQKFRYDELNPVFEGDPVEFLLSGSPGASNEDLDLPFIEMEWTPGDGRSIGTSLQTFQYQGSVSFLVFMPKGLPPHKAKSVVGQLEQSLTHAYKDYPEGTVTFGKARIRPIRPVGTSEMTEVTVETNLLLR